MPLEEFSGVHTRRLFLVGVRQGLIFHGGYRWQYRDGIVRSGVRISLVYKSLHVAIMI